MKIIPLRHLFVRSCLIVCLVTAVSVGVGGQEKLANDDVSKATKKNNLGKKCLFIGHSFFVPVASAFQKTTEQAKIGLHSQQMVFAGGAGGSPGKLWRNDRKKKQILNILDTGKVELLGMTYFSPDNSSTADYRRWIDYALKKNPQTSFFIGLPWGLNGPESSLAAFSAISTVGQAVVYKGTVLKLRELYPETRFYWANYGRVAVELKRNFESGELAGVDAMVARNGKRAIFRDKMGHAASVTLDLSALVWLAVLYDVDLSSQGWVLSQNSKLKEICLKIANEEKKFNVDSPGSHDRPKKQSP